MDCELVNVMSESVVTMHNMRLYQQVARYCVTSLSVCLSVCLCSPKRSGGERKRRLTYPLVNGWVSVFRPSCRSGTLCEGAVLVFVCLSVCLSLASLFVWLLPSSAVLSAVSGCSAAGPPGPQAFQMFRPPWITTPCEIHASGGGLPLAPINAPHLLVVSRRCEQSRRTFYRSFFMLNSLDTFCNSAKAGGIVW